MPQNGNQLPLRAGVGLKPQHYRDILDGAPDIGWFEIHAENYMGEGGPPHAYLTAIRERYPVSLHGVGLSIGGSGPLDKDHLVRLKALIDRYQPSLFSEHLAWSSHDTVYLNDLLPLPYTDETLAIVCGHVDEVQETLGRQMLLENPSTYVAFAGTSMSEVDFLSEIARRTGCGLLLDVNNVFVQAANHGIDATAYLDGFPAEHVGEIHLGGHDEDADDDGSALLIDDHGAGGGRSCLGALRARAFADGRTADPDRMGHRRARLADAVRRGEAGRRSLGRRSLGRRGLGRCGFGRCGFG